MKRAIKNMEEKWERLADVAEGGIANIKSKKAKNIFTGKEPITIGGVPE
jgi:hypothetical protein